MKKGGTFFSRASLTRLSLVTGPCLEKGNATTPFEKRDDVEEGSANDEEEEDDEEEDDEDDDAHLFDDEDDEEAVSDADFEGDSLKARARKAWAATPPVTQVYVGSSLALTLGSFFLAGNQWPQWLNLDWKKVMTGQLWFLSGVSYPFEHGQ